MEPGGLRLFAVLIACGCADPGAGHQRAEIIGGTTDFGDPAVVALRMCRDGGGCSTCTGTLVSRQSVLTASHCLDTILDQPDGVSALFGTSLEDGGVTIVADELLLHRYFDPDLLDFDIAMVHLSEPAPETIDPVVPSERPMSDEDIGHPIRLVGFGETSLGAGDSGTKRAVESVITGLADQHLFVGTEEANTCKGDSGGPTFADLGAGEVQIGVTSRSRSCEPMSVKIRVDLFTDFVWSFVDRFEGPCALDGSCTESCPRSPDPDCDPCLRDGTCATGCAEPDWDCPLGALTGEGCGDASECEFQLCQAGLDDPRVRYCSRPCEPDGPPVCLGGMECVDPDGQGTRCVWPGPTPGALGSRCGLAEDCRSGLCEDGTCVEPCGEVAGGECPAPYECRSSDLGDEVCGPAREDGGGCGCGTGGGSPGLAGLALLLAIAFSGWRQSGRRRRAGACGGAPGSRRARPRRR